MFLSVSVSVSVSVSLSLYTYTYIYIYVYEYIYDIDLDRYLEMGREGGVGGGHHPRRRVGGHVPIIYTHTPYIRRLAYM